MFQYVEVAQKSYWAWEVDLSGDEPRMRTQRVPTPSAHASPQFWGIWYAHPRNSRLATLATAKVREGWGWSKEARQWYRVWRRPATKDKGSRSYWAAAEHNIVEDYARAWQILGLADPSTFTHGAKRQREIIMKRDYLVGGIPHTVTEQDGRVKVIISGPAHVISEEHILAKIYRAGITEEWVRGERKWTGIDAPFDGTAYFAPEIPIAACWEYWQKQVSKIGSQPATTPTTASGECTCDWNSVLATGCRCGAIVPYEVRL